MQTSAHDREDFERAFVQILASVAVAGERGARLIVLPEGTVPAYVIGDEPVDGEQIERAQAAVAVVARRYEATIVYGSARTIDGRTYNTATTIGPDGSLLGAPEKHFLWHFDRRWFAAGRSLEPIDTPVGRLGIMVCADGRIPTIARTLVERGAQMLVMPTAWVTSGRDPNQLENVQADLLINVRAHENGVPFAIANKAGVERRSVAYCGKSAIVGADGIALARAPQQGEALVEASVELAEPDRSRSSERLMASALYLEGAPARSEGAREVRARIAFTAAHEPAELARLAEAAAIAGATHFVAGALPERVPGGLTCVVAEGDTGGTVGAGGLRFEIVADRRLRDPAGLVPARLAGIDLFVCSGFDDDAFGASYVRARALELRAYVLAIDRRRARAFACDPDGTIVAGTFGDYRVAAFAYDRARSAATLVAPGTDVLEGLRAADPHYRAALRDRHPELAAGP